MQALSLSKHNLVKLEKILFVRFKPFSEQTPKVLDWMVKETFSQGIRFCLYTH
jgi:hypothetical protein